MPDVHTSTPPSSNPTTPITKAATVAKPSSPSQVKIPPDTPTPAATPPRMETAVPTAPAAESIASRPPVMYRSTAVQTRPPPNGTIFSLIHGRKPTMQDVERKMGLAGIGRYTGAPNELLHGVLFGEAFERKPNEHVATTVDSDFQTLDAASRQKAMTKAKVKAAMMASKYKSAATEAGCKFFGESKDDKVVHTEGISCSIQLDADGNAQTEEDLTGRFLPNIYRADIGSEDKPQSTPRTSASHGPYKRSPIVMPSYQTQSRPAPSQLLAAHDTQPPHPIPALEPSTREVIQETEPTWDYDSYAFDEWGYVVEVPGPYATDEELFNNNAFVVFDPLKPQPKPRQSKRSDGPKREAIRKRKDSSHIDAGPPVQNNLQSHESARKRKDGSQIDARPTTAQRDLSSCGATRKRKDTSHIEDAEESQRRKRARASSPRLEEGKSQDEPHVREQRDGRYMKRRERSPLRPAHTSDGTPSQEHDRETSRKHEDASRPAHTSRATSPRKRDDRGTSRKHEDPACDSHSHDSHRSRRCSRSRIREESHRSRRAAASRDRDVTRKPRRRSRSPDHSVEEASRLSRNRDDTRLARGHSRSPARNDDEVRPTQKTKDTHTIRHRSRSLVRGDEDASIQSRNRDIAHRRSRSPIHRDEETSKSYRNRDDTRNTLRRSRSPARKDEEISRPARVGRREKQPAPRKEDVNRRTPQAQTPRASVPATPTPTTTIPTSPRKQLTPMEAPPTPSEQHKLDVKAKIAERRAKRSERAPRQAYVPPARRR
jgi:hypothetical protein